MYKDDVHLRIGKNDGKREKKTEKKVKRKKRNKEGKIKKKTFDVASIKAPGPVNGLKGCSVQKHELFSN